MRLLTNSAAVIACIAVACTTAAAQSFTICEGDPTGQVTVYNLDLGPGGATSIQTVRSNVLLRPLSPTTRTANDVGEVDRTRVITRNGIERVELPNGTRLLGYERTDQTGHGLLLVPRTGPARVAFEGPDQLDIPIAVGVDGTHAAFARSDTITIVRLDGNPLGNPLGNGASVRTIQMSASVIERSVVAGPTHLFFLTDDDRVWRCPLAAGMAQDITPQTPGSQASPQQDEAFALSGDGSVVAFLRGEFTSSEYAVWVAGTNGPARRMSLPERNYRGPEYVPVGNGQPHLLLNHAGTRLMVTEIDVEDELHFVDTGIGGAAHHMTGDDLFADYIGGHILPSFSADRLVFASGHVGWMDWYSVQPDGSILNLTQTGSPEPQFLLGALDVRQRFALQNGTALATESLGPVSRLRRLDPAGGSTVLFHDLSAPPSCGGAISGWPDYHIVGTGGERIVSGQDGALRLAVPSGIRLTVPVRSQQGWIATFAHLDAGNGTIIGVPALLLPGGALLLGNPGIGVPQLGWTAADELTVSWPDRLEAFSPQGGRTAQLPNAPRAVLSGAGG